MHLFSNFVDEGMMFMRCSEHALFHTGAAYDQTPRTSLHGGSLLHLTAAGMMHIVNISAGSF